MLYNLEAVSQQRLNVTRAVHLVIGGVHRCNLWGIRGTSTPTFLTEGYRTLTFHDGNVKNLLSLLSTEAICRD